MLVHATAVAVGGRGVLLAGPSGAGKSDLALRLIDRGALLVADDQVEVTRDGDAALLRCPPTIAGLMEVRGLGLLPVAPAGPTPLALWVELDDEAERMPPPDRSDVAGVMVPRVVIDPRRPSAPIKVEWALRMAEETR